MITSEDIMKATGLKGKKTLWRWWHEKMIIPPPINAKHPSGRGTISYWPDWVLDYCIKLVEFRKSGMSLDQAVFHLETEKKKGILQDPEGGVVPSEKHRKNFVPAEKTDEDPKFASLYEHVEKILVSKFGSKSIAKNVTKEMKSSMSLERSLTLLRSGYNPIFIFEGSASYVTSEINLGHFLSKNTLMTEPMIVLPMYKILMDVARADGEVFPFKTSKFPGNKILSEYDDISVEYDYRPFSLEHWDVKWGTPKIKKLEE